MLQPYVQLDESGRPQKGLLPETADGRVVEFYYDTNGTDITVVFVTIPVQDTSRKRAFTVGKTFKTISTLEDFTLVRYDLTDHKILVTLEMFADGSKRQIDASRLLDY